MGKREISSYRDVLIIGLGIILAYLLLISMIQLPGIDDALIYYHAAERFIGGHGWTLPYIWNYFSNPQSVNPPAFGYWMPGASFIIAGSILLLGNSVDAILVPWAILASSLSIVSYFISKRLTSNRMLSIFSAFLISVHPLIIEFGTRSESTLPNALFGSICLFLIVSSITKPMSLSSYSSLFLAGIILGLALLTRGDALITLILGVSLIWIVGFTRQHITIKQAEEISKGEISKNISLPKHRGDIITTVLAVSIMSGGYLLLFLSIQYKRISGVWRGLYLLLMLIYIVVTFFSIMQAIGINPSKRPGSVSSMRRYWRLVFDPSGLTNTLKCACIYTSFFLIGLLVVVTPWYARNLLVFGNPIPPGASKVLLLRSYEDIYRYTKPLSFYGYLSYMSHNFSGILNHKITVFSKLMGSLFYEYGLFFPILFLGVLDTWRRREFLLVLVGLVYVAICLVFYSFIATEISLQSSFRRSSLVALPFLVAGTSRGLRVVGNRKLQTAVVSILLIIMLVSSVSVANRQISGRGFDLTWISKVLEDAGDSQSIIMSRKPWRVYESTDLPSIQIPNNDREMILKVAKRYGADYLHLQSKKDNLALKFIYLGLYEDYRYELIYEYGPHKLYHLNLTTIE